MSRAVAAISVVLGAGFTSLTEVITQLTVYDGATPGLAVLPILVGFGIAAIEATLDDDQGDLPDGLTDEEIRNLGGEPDA